MNNPQQNETPMATPSAGHWRIEENYRRREFYISAPGWQELAVVNGNFDDDELHAQGEANARVIVLAREFLEFVETYWRWLNSNPTCEEHDELDEEMARWMDTNAPLLLAKAKGEIDATPQEGAQ